MTSAKKAVYAAKIGDDYVVIGRCLNYAIVKNEVGNMYYLDDENAVLEEGDICTGEFLKPIDELPGIIKEVVIMTYGNEVA